MQFAPTLPLVVFVSEKGATAATDGSHLVAILFAGGGTFRAQNHVVAGNYKSVAIGAARILAVFALHNFFPTFGASRGRLFFVHLYFGFELLRAAFILPQHFLYFKPLPHGHGSLRPIFSPLRTYVLPPPLAHRSQMGRQ